MDNFKKGTYTSKDGASYNGEFKDSVKNGKGELTVPGKLIYKGDFVNDKFEGEGELIHI